MSDLEDLGEIADQCALGSSGLSHRSIGKKRGYARCGLSDHMKGANIHIYRVKGKKTRIICKLCDKVRRQHRANRPTYGSKGYPL